MCPCWSNPWGSRRVGAGIVVISRTVTGYSFKEPLFQEVAQKSLDCDRQNSYPRIAQSRTCLWVSADPRYGEDLVRYLELTPPVVSPANRLSEDILKQRRCGPFWCLPAFQQPGLLKRHTFIAERAVGIPFQSKADMSG